MPQDENTELLSLPTQNLTQNRKIPYGNNGVGRAKEYLDSEHMATNGSKSARYDSSDKLRTRRPGVRIPQGVPMARKIL